MQSSDNPHIYCLPWCAASHILCFSLCQDWAPLRVSPRSISTSSLPHLPSIASVLKSQFPWNPWNLNSIINIFYYELSLFIEGTKPSTAASWFSLSFKEVVHFFSPDISRITTFPSSYQHSQTIIISLLFKKVRCTFIYVPIYHE